MQLSAAQFIQAELGIGSVNEVFHPRGEGPLVSAVAIDMHHEIFEQVDDYAERNGPDELVENGLLSPTEDEDCALSIDEGKFDYAFNVIKEGYFYFVY